MKHSGTMKAVLADDLKKSMEFVRVYAADITNKKETSRLTTWRNLSTNKASSHEESKMPEGK